MDNCKR